MSKRLLIGVFAVLLAVPAHADERTVRRVFQDTPILIKIAKCESGFRQIDKKGRALKNPRSSATGVMQIMASYHQKPAKRLGYNIQTLEGNLKYAKWLYKREGTRPWNASKHCWGKRSA